VPLTPELTYAALLVVQTLHLLHHRLVKRHISFAEVISAGVLCIPPVSGLVGPVLLMGLHVVLIALQVIGSVFIQRLSPDWVPSASTRLG
jgi:hypothetical protein